MQSLGSYLLPVLVPDLHEEHPHLGLYVREGLPAALLDALEAGTLDLLFFPLPIGRAEIETVPLFREPLHFVASRDHPLADRAEILHADLRGETLLTLEQGQKLYEQLKALAEEYEARLSYDCEGTSLDTLRQMIAMGMGVSLLPALYVRSEVARENLVVARPLAEPSPSRTIGLAWRKGTAREAEFRQLGQFLRSTLCRRAPEVQVI